MDKQTSYNKERMMRVPQPIPYQGSKRNLAKFILPFFPLETSTLVEPFAGSAAISLASACHGKASQFHLNDINQPLMSLWREIIYNPAGISDSYEKLWNEQKSRQREFYDFVRDEFNKTKRPDYLLYLLARCVKASVRYNSRGEFNQSPDNRRKGREPSKMRDDIFAASNLLRGRTTVSNEDYKTILQLTSDTNLIYMDPPYQGVCESNNPRYFTGIDFEEFVSQLTSLKNRRIPFTLSYDARRGEVLYGKKLPAELGLYRTEVKVGRSAQSTLLGRSDVTHESIYFSPELVSRLGPRFEETITKISSVQGTQSRLL